MFKQSQALLAISLLTVLTTTVLADGGASHVRYVGNLKHPDLPDHCYFPEYNLTIPVNETIYPIPTDLKDICISLECRNDYIVKTEICKYLGPICHFKDPDSTKPYPECCGTVTCKN